MTHVQPLLNLTTSGEEIRRRKSYTDHAHSPKAGLATVALGGAVGAVAGPPVSAGRDTARRDLRVPSWGVRIGDTGLVRAVGAVGSVREPGVEAKQEHVRNEGSCKIGALVQNTHQVPFAQPGRWRSTAFRGIGMIMDMCPAARAAQNPRRKASFMSKND